MPLPVVDHGPSRRNRALVVYLAGVIVLWAYIEGAWWWWWAKWRVRRVVPWGLRRWLWLPPPGSRNAKRSHAHRLAHRLAR